jgi:hypothetical protein
MKKVAPPGRRAALRVKKFTADEEEVQPIQTAAADYQSEDQQQPQQHEQPPESEEYQHATTALQEDAAEQEQRQSTGSVEESNGHEKELSEMTHGSSTAARTDEDNGDEEDDADDVDDAEDEEAKAQALAMQQEAERLANQIKAEQEYVHAFLSVLRAHAHTPQLLLLLTGLLRHGDRSG